MFGDLYARDNAVLNQELIPFIEANGGEVITTPYSTYLKMIAQPYLRKWFVEGHYLEALSSGVLMAGLKLQEKTYCRYFDRILAGPSRGSMTRRQRSFPNTMSGSRIPANRWTIS